jgi:transcriptional regulator with XRE-family HTH domain
MSWGDRLRELRKAAGLSQPQLARLAGVTRNAVSQWEAGKTKPSSKRLVQLSRALNVPIDQIMAPSTNVRECIVDAALRLFGRLGVDEISIDVICASAEVARAEFDSLFESKDALLFELMRTLNDRTLEDVRRTPAKYGSLAARLKYLLRQFYVHDLAHQKLTAALQSYSWRWSEVRDREHGRSLLEFHETIIALFDEAAAQGQIDAGNYRAASSLILAAYQLGLRKAIFENCDPDRIITLLEPQLAIILGGFNFRVIPGFSESAAPT